MTDHTDTTERWLADTLGAHVRSTRPLSGGCIGDVSLIETERRDRAVLKRGGAALATEAAMLRTLAERSDLPVPAVLGEADGLLLMEYIDTGGSLDDAAQAHAADLLAALHDLTPDRHHAAGPDGQTFGFEHDTLIGSLDQPNPWTHRWLDFFRDHRLLYMAHAAHDAGRLPNATLRDVERLADKLTEADCPPPAGAQGPRGRLLHGDCWTGNVLTAPGGDRIAAFIDPAVYYGHPEIELAFSTLFGTFDKPFFDRYAERSDAVEDWPGFWNRRRDLYNLYPLLVHTRLFGGHYAAQVRSTLNRLG